MLIQIQRVERGIDMQSCRHFFILNLCLVILLVIPIVCTATEALTIGLDCGGANQFIKLAKENFYTLPATTVNYSTYPLMIRLRSGFATVQPHIEAVLSASFQDDAGLLLPNTCLDWVLGTWIWEGREDEGPAPGIQFNAIVPILSSPGRYTAQVQINVYADTELATSFPVAVSLTVPRWATCFPWPEVHPLGENRKVQFSIAANTNWSLWLSSPKFSAAQLVGTGGTTLASSTGYTTRTYQVGPPYADQNFKVVLKH